MSYSFYHFVHLVSLFVVFLTLGGICFHMLNGGNKDSLKIRKSLAIINGIALLVTFVAGFGLIAKAQYSLSSSPWIYGKMLCWFIIAGFPTLSYKKVLPRWADFAVLVLVMAAAVALVVFKPI